MMLFVTAMKHSTPLQFGEVVEWFKAAVLKTAVVARSPWVRIPPSPPFKFKAYKTND
jgi:hypothetical protein